MQRSKSEVDGYWQTAGDRVFLYLRCLNLPPAQTLDLSLRALNEAERNILKDDLRDNPVAEAVEALHELLRKQPSKMVGENILSNWCERKRMQKIETDDISFAGDGSRYAVPLSSMPPVRRLHMTPQELSQTHLSELFGNLTRKSKKYSGKVK
jgi:hypothetical protein